MKHPHSLLKRPSFRLRIALLSSLLAGGALVGFGGMSWWSIYKTKLNRIDDGIKNQLIREADRPRPQNHWKPYAQALLMTFNTDNADDVALFVQTTTGETVYQSSAWSVDLKHRTSFPTSPPARPRLSTARDSHSGSERLVRPRFPPKDHPPPKGQPPEPPNGLSPNGLSPNGHPPEPPNGLLPNQLPANRPEMVRMPMRLSSLSTQSTSRGSWRVMAVASPDTRIAIAVNLRTIEPEMNVIRNAYLVSIPALLVLIAIGAWSLSGRALKPLQQVTQTLRQVTAQGLDQRVPVNGSDREFVELLQVFNQMMERLERSFTQASRFSADAAHELKTPLSILQGELERTMQSAAPGSELQQRLGGLLDEVRHLSTIVRKLLLLSLADTGQMRVYKTAVNLSELLTDLASDIDLLSPDLTVQIQVEPGLTLPADQSLLIQVLQNLISNAIKYNLPQGWVRIEAKQQPSLVLVKISNSSKDIPPHERSRIFDRFHRGDPARTRQVEGLGLGLSLSREIVYAHGGNLTLDATPSGQTTFTLTLPL
ncbi:MAG: ATP-binding protein [Synechococcales bacterium]|nr:ATP-binding protein [Synechococcales bacterium]